jgi:AcrR family transcriptional regulator
LDAVAAEAGISKGGLLHHFPSKGALAEAVLRYRLERFEARVQEYLEQEPAGSGRWLRAYVRAAFDEEPVPIELWTLVMTLATEGASARAMLEATARRWQQRLFADGLPVARAFAVMQSADGYWTMRAFGMRPESGPLRDAICDELLRLTRSAPGIGDG